MRRSVAAILFALGSVGLIAGCQAEEVVTPPAPVVEVAGAFGQRPTVTLPEGLVVDQTTTAVLIEGSGAPLTEGSSVLLDYYAVDAVTGEVVADTFGTLPEVRTLTAADVGQPLFDLLNGKTEGSRVERVELGTPQRPNPHVIVVDVVPSQATGTAIAPAEGAPTVVLGPDGAPTITIPALDPPNKVSTSVLIKGDGPQVGAGQSVIVQLTAVRWADGAVVDSTWGVAPRAMAVADGYPGLRAGLIEASVGSQILIVIPPVEGNQVDTLVYVVDILASADVVLPPGGTDGQPDTAG